MDETVNVSYDPGNLHVLPLGTFLQGRYQLQHLLGQGGFGITYLAWDRMSQTRVAVKEFFPRSIVSRDCSWSLDVQCNTQTLVPNFQSSKDRFLREAEAMGRVREVPAIVEIRDYFEENNTAYIVMDYIAGVNLKDYVLQRGGCLSVGETLRILEPVVQALIHVHKTGLVHRDISPDNIMLHPTEGAKLLDFGAVRSVENPQMDKELSHSTEAILKHGFAPIEQYHSRGALGPWTDEYALCATIWFCLTGRVPEPVPTRMTEDIHPAWSSIPGLTPVQSAALEKGMAVKAKDRFPGVEQLYEALYLNRGPSADSQRKNPPRGKVAVKILIGVLAVALAAALGLGIWKLTESDGDSQLRGGTTSGEKQENPPRQDPAIPKPTEDPGQSTPPEVPSDAPDTKPTAPSPSQEWVNNVMVKDPLNVLLGVSPEDEEMVLESRRKIQSITFLDDVSGKPDKVYNLGAGGTDSVIGWIEWNGGYIDVYIGGNGGIDASESCRQLFYGCANVLYINFGGAFHTDGCEDMYRMFSGCQLLRGLDVSFFDTSHVVTMQEMFRECKNLTELDVSNFDTSRVTNMNAMFSTCSELTFLDLRSFDTSRVTNMGYMFSASRYLENVDVSSFDTSKVTNMAGMFAWCGSLEDMDLSGWSIDSVKDYSGFMNDGKTINGRPWKEFFQK